MADPKGRWTGQSPYHEGVPDLITKYFVNEKGIGQSITAVALKLGITLTTLYNWMNDYPAVKEAVEFGRVRATSALESIFMEKTIEGDKFNANFAGLAMYNLAGWRKDTQTIVINPLQERNEMLGKMKDIQSSAEPLLEKPEITDASK